VGPRSAPRRRVVEVWKTGDYGTTIWHHRLDCGHIEQRKRRRPSDEIGCVRCEAGDRFERRAGAPLATVLEPEPNLDEEVAVLRARLAAGLGVSSDSVSVQMVGGRLAGVLVVLDLEQVREIIQR